MMKAHQPVSGMSAAHDTTAQAMHERSAYNEAQALKLRVQSLESLLRSCKTALQASAETSALPIVGEIERGLATAERA